MVLEQYYGTQIVRPHLLSLIHSISWILSLGWNAGQRRGAYLVAYISICVVDIVYPCIILPSGLLAQCFSNILSRCLAQYSCSKIFYHVSPLVWMLLHICMCRSIWWTKGAFLSSPDPKYFKYFKYCRRVCVRQSLDGLTLHHLILQKGVSWFC